MVFSTISLVPQHFMALAGISIGASVVNAFFNGLTSWIVAGSTGLLTALGHVIAGTTDPPLKGGFSVELAVVVKIGAALTAPFLAVAVISAIVQQDIGILWRAVFVRLPFSLLFGAVAVQIVSLALGATDGLSDAVLQAAGPSIQSVLAGLATALVGLTKDGSSFGAFGAVFLAGITVFVAFLLWLELVIRGAAITVAVLFLPLALAGLVWPATAHWARRLGETIAALVLSKLVIAAVLGLAATTIGEATGASAVVEGIAILLLAVLAPFSLLRLVPAVEMGAMAHLEGMSHRATRLARSGASYAAGVVGGAGNDMVGPISTAPGVGFHPGVDVNTPRIQELAKDVQREMDLRVSSGEPNPATSSTVPVAPSQQHPSIRSLDDE